jgi:ADP-L-glycero-D-manno-heptose 6-epimerase
MYVVTGGCGFIGSNLVKCLNGKGINNVVIVDDLTDSRKLATLNTLEFAKYMDVDHIDWQWLADNKIEKVFHIGGISSTVEQNGKLLMHYNCWHTERWAEFCRYHNIPLVYTSSASVYGNSKTFIETQPATPLNAYAMSKYISERMLKNQPNLWIFRPFNVYGYSEDHKDNQQSPISKFKQEFDDSGTVTLFDNSDTIFRDFVCVQDVVTILSEYTNKNPGTYNLGSGHATSFLNIAKLYTENVRYIPMPIHLAGKYQYFSKADLTKLRKNLIHDYRFIQPHEYVCQH